MIPEIKYCKRKDFLDWYMNDGYDKIVGQYVKKILLRDGEVYLSIENIFDHVVDCKLVPPELFGIPFLDDEFFELRLEEYAG